MFRNFFRNLLIRVRVRRGVKYLNEFYPNWQNRINVYDLNMRSRGDCILGQLAGDYSHVFGPADDKYATSLGLQIANPLLSNARWFEQYAALTDRWKKVIRREQAKELAA